MAAAAIELRPGGRAESPPQGEALPPIVHVGLRAEAQ